MLRCNNFRYYAPTTVEEAARILSDEGPAASILGGGTDLVPNMKRRQQTPASLVAVRRIPSLKLSDITSGGARLGAGLTLTALARDGRLSPWRALVRAATSVASPQIRNVGTLGGNLCLDTRCNYYDQSFEWRKAIDFCMKKPGPPPQDGGLVDPSSGTVCWVAPGSARCWAVSSTDTAPALAALGAEVTLHSAAGARTCTIAQLYKDDGIDYLNRRPSEILTEVRLPDPTGWASTYWKLRRRGSIDFPVLGVAAAVKRDAGGTVEEARVYLGAVASHPVELDVRALVGSTLTDEAIERVADAGAKHAKPLDNTDYTIGWRKRVARSFLVGALKEIRGDDPATLGALARHATAMRVV